MKNIIAKFKKESFVLIFLCILLFAISYTLMLGMMQVPYSDLHIHALNADFIAFHTPNEWFQVIAHPFWHFHVLFFRMIGVPFTHAAVIVTAATKTILMVLVYLFYRFCTRDLNIHPALTAVLAFLTVIVAAVRIPSVNPNVYSNAGSPNPWHSPTQLMMMVWMLLCLFFLCHSYDRQQCSEEPCTLSWKETALFAALLLLSLMSKPVFVQCFFPGAAVYFLFQWIKHPRWSRYYVRLLISLIPTILFLFLQFNSYFGAESNSDVAIALDRQQVFSSTRTFLLLNAFPLCILLTTRKTQKGSMVPIVLLSNLFALLECCVLGESGARANHGNWEWALLSASFLMWIAAIPQYVRLWQQKKSWRKKLLLAASSVLLVWHLTSGIYYLHYLFTSGFWY